MSSGTLLAIANLLLPEVLVTYFGLTKHQIKEGETHFYFTELNELPEEFKTKKLHSKDFPIRGKNVFLHITRRRWFNEDTMKVVTRDWNLVAKGTRITSGFATFFKDLY